MKSGALLVKLPVIILICLSAFNVAVFSQVKVRIFSGDSPESSVFSVTGGEYDLIFPGGGPVSILKGEPVIIQKLNGKLAVKARNSEGIITDSILIKGKTGNDFFSLRINGPVPQRKNYSGDLLCFADLETLVLINDCDIDDYIAGVVLAEGGSGRNKEYFKAQAVIARTYLYKYFDKHLSDRFNVCDNIHCQVYKGICTDPVINLASLETKNLVATDKDSILIISAFHSNCGGETSSSEYVWLARQPYLKKVIDPYCIASRNAIWEKKVTLHEWTEMMKRSGYRGVMDQSAAFNFSQKTRMNDYTAGSFRVPLSVIRNDLSLRSTFFSVVAGKDHLILRGRGYGHGVGLCQEGAMEMAARGFNYRSIIDFYYSGVIVLDVKNVNLPLP
jgi:stage II sporulation protein D